MVAREKGNRIVGIKPLADRAKYLAEVIVGIRYRRVVARAPQPRLGCIHVRWWQLHRSGIVIALLRPRHMRPVGADKQAQRLVGLPLVQEFNRQPDPRVIPTPFAADHIEAVIPPGPKVGPLAQRPGPVSQPLQKGRQFFYFPPRPRVIPPGPLPPPQLTP